MSDELASVIRFPDGFPNAITGAMTEDGVLLTGHEDGLVVRWNLDNNSYKVLHDCHSDVMTISISRKNEVIVGCHSGLVLLLDLGDPAKKTIIQDAEFSRYSRVWRTAWLDDDQFVMTSTYGVINVFRRHQLGWLITPISGHTNSVFGLACKDGQFVTGDYGGDIFVWRVEGASIEKMDQFSIRSGVQGISWHEDGSLSVIDRMGRVHVFEFDPAVEHWRSVFETDTATSSGTAIHVMSDGRSIFGGTDSEVIQFDSESQQVLEIPHSWVKGFFSKGNAIFVLSSRGMESFERKEITTPDKSVHYRYSKVSLIGHTGVGKSTLASLLVDGTAEGIPSTFGKRVWMLNLGSDSSSAEKRIIFHDHGGQESVLGTFLPFLTDSDIVLIFFKQTDDTTYQKALELLSEVEELSKSRIRVFFVETYIDQEMNEINEEHLAALIKSGRVVKCFRLSPTKNIGICEFK